MDANVLIPAVTAVLSGAFFIALLDQWRTRRRGYQAIWALGMLFFSIAIMCQAIAAAVGWSEPRLPHLVPHRARSGRPAGWDSATPSSWAVRASVLPSPCACSWPGCSPS